MSTFEPSQTSLLCFAYCSTIGRMLVVTMRCALLKLWSISCNVSVIDCSNFSSSSVSVKPRGALDRDMFAVFANIYPARRVSLIVRKRVGCIKKVSLFGKHSFLEATPDLLRALADRCLLLRFSESVCFQPASHERRRAMLTGRGVPIELRKGPSRTQVGASPCSQLS